MATIGLYVLLFCLLVAVVQYVIHQRFGIVAASWFGWAPGSVGIIAIGIAMTNVLLAITDALCAYMLTGLDIGGFLEHLAVAFSLVAVGGALTGTLAFAAGFIAILFFALALGIFVELLMRQVVMYLCLLWLPLVASASPARRTWLYRLLALHLTVIFSKFAVVTCLVLGVAAFAANPNAMGSLGDSNLTAIVIGLIVLALTLASPFLLLRLLPHGFEHAASGLSNFARKRTMRLARRGGRGLSRRFASNQAAKSGVQIASKTVGAGAAAVVPISLVVGKGGQIIAARGGKVLKQGAAVAQGPAKAPTTAPQRRPKKGTPASGYVTPTAAPRAPRRSHPAPGPVGRRPPTSYPSPPPPRPKGS